MRVLPVASLLDEALALWRACPETRPDLGPPSPPQQQSANEPFLERFIQSLHSELQRLPNTRAQRSETHQRITAAFTTFGRSALGFSDEHLHLLLGNGFSSIGTQMARRARSFDPSVPLDDILQASRNAWTACGLQVLFGRSMDLTPSIFAYSMLYPYSDNYMDDPQVDSTEKRGFSARFRQRLSGELPDPANTHEATIWRLVSLIEDQYPRLSQPGVYDSLLAIHHAQEQSLRLRKSVCCSPREIEALSFEKGGTSVLADAWLAAAPTPDSADASDLQLKFAFLWGILLQLGDDLQDLREDLSSGTLTVFSNAASHQPLDALTNRTLHFARHVMALMAQLPGPPPTALMQLIRRSSLSLIIRAAGEGAEYYTPEYLQFLESHSPFRFAFLEERRRRIADRNILLARLFEAFLSGDSDEPAFPWLPNSLLPR